MKCDFRSRCNIHSHARIVSLFIGMNIYKFSNHQITGSVGSIFRFLDFAPSITTHLLSIERTDWPKLHNMLKARDANLWQHEIHYSSFFFMMLLFVSKADAWLKKNVSGWSVNSFDCAREKCTIASARVLFVPCKIERVNRLTRRVFRHDALVDLRFEDIYRPTVLNCTFPGNTTSSLFVHLFN